MTSWFRRRAARSGEESTTQAAEPAAAQEAESFHSPGLKLLFASLQQRGGSELLDLGSAVPENVQALARLPARLYIEDLYGTLREDTLRNGRRPGGAPAAGELVRYPPEVLFDAVLAWDLLDYLEGEILAAVVPRLARHCRPGAWLYTLMSYRATMPEEPLRFKILDFEHLSYTPAADGRTRPSPRPGARDLARRLPGFRLHTSYLLRNGYQEFLFTRE